MSNARFTNPTFTDQPVLLDTGPTKSKTTRLEPRNEGRFIEEGLQARVKDPLWFLGRQWQTSEFRAHNGGQLVRTELDVSSKPLNQIEPMLADGETETEAFDLCEPLEMKVEEELGPDTQLSAKHWDPQHLEYNFGVTDGDTRLDANEYDGQRLDWYSFNVSTRGEFSETTQHLALRPSLVTFPGAPLPRWWSFEDRRIGLGETKRPQLSFMTMLLTEFALMYSNDWFVLPVTHTPGHIRRIDNFTAMDSFGVVFQVHPVIDPSNLQSGWEVFTLTAPSQTRDGRLLYVPNTLYHALESEAYESVSLIRDETANLVWAIEHSYQSDKGQTRKRHDEEASKIRPPPDAEYYWDSEQQILVHRSEIFEEDKTGDRYQGPVSVYVPKTDTPSNWIPYVMRQQKVGGQPALRRGRTIEDLTEGPQYKGLLLKESKWIFEEEIQTTGLNLSRVYQLARDEDGNRYLWRSRKKSIGDERSSSGLRFDSLTTGT